MDDVSTATSIGTVLSVIGVYILNHFKVNKVDKTNEGRYTAIEHRFTALETKVEPFWNLIQTKLVDILHSEHPARYYVLRDKFKLGTLTTKESIEFKEMIEESILEYQKTDPTKFLVAVLVLSKLESDLKAKKL